MPFVPGAATSMPCRDALYEASSNELQSLAFSCFGGPGNTKSCAEDVFGHLHHIAARAQKGMLVMNKSLGSLACLSQSCSDLHCASTRSRTLKHAMPPNAQFAGGQNFSTARLANLRAPSATTTSSASTRTTSPQPIARLSGSGCTSVRTGFSPRRWSSTAWTRHMVL